MKLRNLFLKYTKRPTSERASERESYRPTYILFFLYKGCYYYEK